MYQFPPSPLNYSERIPLYFVASRSTIVRRIIPPLCSLKIFFFPSYTRTHTCAHVHEKERKKGEWILSQPSERSIEIRAWRICRERASVGHSKILQSNSQSFYVNDTLCYVYENCFLLSRKQKEERVARAILRAPFSRRNYASVEVSFDEIRVPRRFFSFPFSKKEKLFGTWKFLMTCCTRLCDSR